MSRHNLIDEDSNLDAFRLAAAQPPHKCKMLRVLVVNGAEADFIAIRSVLAGTQDVGFELRHATHLAAGMQLLQEESFHAVLLDWNLPDGRGIACFRRLRDIPGDVPVIVLTSLEEEGDALQAVREGAQDYLLKDAVDDDILLRSLRYSLARHRTRRKLKRALELVERSESSLRNVLQGSIDGIIVVDHDNRVRFSNRAAQLLLGETSEELLYKSLDLGGVPDVTAEIEIAQPSGNVVPVEQRVVSLEWEGNPARLIMLRDLTLRRRSEKALRDEKGTLQSILESANEGVVVVDNQGQFILFNPAAERILGRGALAVPPEKWVQHYGIFLPDKVTPYPTEKLPLVRAMYGENTTDALMYIHGALGNAGRWVSVNAAPLLDENKELRGGLVTIRDISERVFAEAQITASAEKHRSIVEASSDAIIVADERGLIVEWNAAAARLFGYTKQEIVNKPLTLLMPARYREQHQRSFARVCDSKSSRLLGRPIQLHGRRKDGNEFPLELSLSSWLSSEGRFFCGSIRDSTIRVQAEAESTKRIQAERELHFAEEKINIAREVQESLFPSQKPLLPDFDIAGKVYAADKASGDYFDFVRMSKYRLGLAVADVSGHGLGPALLMARTQAFVRALAEVHANPGRILTHTNRLLTPSHPGTFITLFYGQIDARQRRFRYASAGHLAYHMKRSGATTKLGSRNLPLGLAADEKFSSVEKSRLELGDVLLIATDGLQETAAPDGSLFGVSRMLSVLYDNRHLAAAEIIAQLYRAARKFAAGGRQRDDMTILVVKACKN